jgi:hypothetical protein
MNFLSETPVVFFDTSFCNPVDSSLRRNPFIGIACGNKRPVEDCKQNHS